jgi:hypothetical protein
MTYRTPEELTRVRSRTGVLPLNETHAVNMEKEFQAGMLRLTCPDCGIWIEMHREQYAKVGAPGMNCPSSVSHDGFGCRTFMEVSHA